MVKNECGQSGDRTLKLSISEDSTDGINMITIKSLSNIFGSAFVKNECGQPGYGAVKFTVPQK